LKYLILINILLLISSCSFLKRTFGFNSFECNNNTAFQKGSQDAGKWWSPIPIKSASICGEMEDYSPREYVLHYRSGYRARMNEQCSPDQIENINMAVSSRMNLSKENLTIYQLCDQAGINFQRPQRRITPPRMVKTKYQFFKRGTCSEKRTENAAKIAAERLLFPDEQFLNYCHREKQIKLKKLYRRIYQDNILESCRLSEIKYIAINDVQSGRKISEGLRR
jgi:hypothetical protein